MGLAGPCLLTGVYKRSLLKAYQRTLDEARFKFVILDAPNIRAGDFRDFWMAGQAAGYEVFLVEMPESDPQVGGHPQPGCGGCTWYCWSLRWSSAGKNVAVPFCGQAFVHCSLAHGCSSP